MVTSEKAKEFWYLGMTRIRDADPTLIARSSTFPFLYENYRFGVASVFPREPLRNKVMSTVGDHPIVKAYDSIRSQVLQALNGIRWETVDVVRLGHEGDQDHPPVVLVTVDKERVHGGQAQTSVDQIHKVMIEHDLADVHCEMKSGRYYPQVDYQTGKLYPITFLQTPPPGSSISSSEAPFRTGSIGLYLKIGEESFALTCEHVVRLDENSGPENSPYSLAEMATDDQIAIMQPSASDVEKEEAKITDDINENKRMCDEYNAKLASVNAGEAIPLNPYEKTEGVEACKELKLANARKDVLDSFKPSMRFGTLFHTPGISRDPVNGCIQDWALVKLDGDRFPKLPRNVFPITDFSRDEEKIIQRRGGKMNQYPWSTAAISKISTVTMVNNTLKSEDDITVLKHGRTSGWTSGRLNEIRSDCRRSWLNVDREDLLTTELCVVNIRDMNHFSYKGDSGSCVFSKDGEIFGILHGANGDGQYFGSEITYVTPIQWVLDGVKRELELKDDLSLEVYAPST